MRRKWIITLSTGAAVLLAAALWISFLGADPAGREARVQPEENGKAGGDAALPIRQVVLFNTGVGYFQREGQVDGTSRVELTFPAYDMNDLLKSLVLQDNNGGKIASVNYDSYDPIEKTLRSFAIDLSSNPTFGQILNQARGEKIDVVRVDKPEKKEGDKKEPDKREAIKVKLSGTIVGMETQVKQKKTGEMHEIEILNLTTDAGLQAIPLEDVASVRFVNQTLEKEFQRALLVLARAHDTQKKTISLGFQGDGKRTVRVGYVVERPIWKTSYRLRIEDGNKLFLQAWAMVENTSDDDWNGVHMVLVSGRPISYKMNLYEPLYIPRPEVEPELFASLRPPVYGGTFSATQEEGAQAKVAGKAAAPMENRLLNSQQTPFMQPPIGGYLAPSMGGFGNFGGGFGNFGGGLQGFQGMGNSVGNPMFNNRYANPYGYLQNNEGFNAKLTYEQLQQRQKQQEKNKDDAKKVVAGLNFKEGVSSVANAEEVGDYYQYVLDQKINLSRQKSAMLPIMNKAIEGTKVSIYNHAVQSKFPLLGLRLKNTSGQPLTQGPITVYEGQTYAGDTRVLDLQPGEERLLSYAIDQSTEVVTVDTQSPGPELHFKVSDDHLATNYKVRHTRSYTLKNRSTHERTTIIEHPITAGWKLLQPEKPAEKSRDVYRFEVKVAAGKTVSFKVTEEETRDDNLKFAVTGHTRTVNPRDDIHVKLVHKTFEPKITGMRFEKGVLHLKKRVRESTSYFVQNLSTQERHANIDYVVRPDWKLLEGDEPVKAGAAVQRVRLTVPAEKTAVKEFIDERIVPETVPPLATLPEERAKELLSSPAGSAEVKAGLGKALDMLRKLRETKAQQAGLEAELKALTEDQERMRKNLTIIPQSSDPYKKFLEKFVAQETAVEGLQKQVRQVQATVQQSQRDYDLFIANLNAE
jgi:hypothetical protein